MFEYDQAGLQGEVLKENNASQHQRCFDGVDCLEKSRSGPRAKSFVDDDLLVATNYKKQTISKRTVSFSPALCQVIHIDNQTEGLENELWYSQYDFMLFEDQAFLCSQAVQESFARGSFDGEIGNILGLEKILLWDSYYDRRQALRNAVMDEHSVQSLAKEIRMSSGCCESDCAGKTEDMSHVQLAETSERNSLWARERACMAALTLEHDLATCRAQEDSFEDNTG
jgi:hypothetical protein